VTVAATLPALLVSHDQLADVAVARVQAVIEGAGRKIVTKLSTDNGFDPNVLGSALHESGADDPFQIVHIVGPLKDPSLSIADRGDNPIATLVSAIGSVQDAIVDRWPGKRRRDLWVIHTVGQIIDDVERDFINTVTTTFASDLCGFVVSASTTKASVVHDDDEQAGFAADLALLLVGSGIGQDLKDSGITTWVAGANSVRYSRRDHRRQLATDQGVLFLEKHLLATPPANDPSFKMGQSWVERLELLDDAERRRIIEAGAGETLLQRVDLGDIDWNSVPLTSWVDALTTQQTVRALTQLDDIDRVIDRAVEQRVETLKRSLVSLARDQVVSTERLEAAIATAQGARVNLEQLGNQLDDAPSTVDVAAIASDRAKLRRMARWMPFGPAVALRTFGFALAVLLVVASATDGTSWGTLSWVGEPWGRVFGIVTLVVCFVLYQRRVAAMLRVRDRLTSTLERQLTELVEARVVAARHRTLNDLCAWIGERPEWLDTGEPPERPEVAPDLSAWFAWVIVEFRRATGLLGGVRDEGNDRSAAHSVQSRYVLDLPEASTDHDGARVSDDRPHSADVLVKELVGHLPQAYDVGLALGEVSGLQHVVIELLAGSDEVPAKGQLASFLRVDKSSCAAARRVLEADTTPVLALDNAGHGQGLHHFLAIEGGKDGPAYRTLFGENAEIDSSIRRVSPMLERVVDVDIPGVAVMGHLFSLGSITIADPEGHIPEGAT